MTDKLMKKIWTDDEWLRKTDLFHNDFEFFCKWMNTKSAMEDRINGKWDIGKTPAEVCDWHGYLILQSYFTDEELYKNKARMV